MPVKKYLRQHIYRWHRVTALIAAVPILLWSLSGFLYPVMNSFKPEVKNQLLPVRAIDTRKIHVALQQALRLNNIAFLHNFRIVNLDGTYYYQIQQINSDTCTYLSCADGSLLKKGDALYASYLAQRYLSQPIARDKHQAPDHQMGADIGSVASALQDEQPCHKTKITAVVLVRKFDREYKGSNVLLPVYKVNFDRADGIRLYVETSTDRLATAIDDKKAWFNRFFALTHSWSFLDGTGVVKNIVVGTFSFLCLVSSLLGYLVYHVIRGKKTTSHGKSWHRTLGNVFILTTALYGFSGGWHAFHKFSSPNEIPVVADRSQFPVDEVNFSLTGVAKWAGANEKLTNISIVKMNGENYWQLYLFNGKEKQKKYLNTKTLEELQEGDLKYGRYLAGRFSGQVNAAVLHTESLNRFTTNYSMMNRRLPVIEVGFDGNREYYVETSTGHLSAETATGDKAERFSFTNLHMHHYWEDWLGEKGKTVQKAVFLSTTFGLLLMALTGCWIYWRKRHKALL